MGNNLDGFVKKILAVAAPFKKGTTKVHFFLPEYLAAIGDALSYTGHPMASGVLFDALFFACKTDNYDTSYLIDNILGTIQKYGFQTSLISTAGKIPDKSVRLRLLSAVIENYADVRQYEKAFHLLRDIKDRDFRNSALSGISSMAISNEDYPVAHKAAMQIKNNRMRSDALIELIKASRYENYFSLNGSVLLDELCNIAAKTDSFYRRTEIYHKLLKIDSDNDRILRLLQDTVVADTEDGISFGWADMVIDFHSVSGGERSQIVENLINRAVEKVEKMKVKKNDNHHPPLLMSDIASVMARLSDDRAMETFREALIKAELICEDPEDFTFGTILGEIIDAGYMEELLHLSQSVRKRKFKNHMMKQMAISATERGKCDLALKAIDNISNRVCRNETFEEMARCTLRFDKKMEFARMISNIGIQQELFEGIASNMAESGRFNESISVLNEIKSREIKLSIYEMIIGRILETRKKTSKEKNIIRQVIQGLEKNQSSRNDISLDVLISLAYTSIGQLKKAIKVIGKFRDPHQKLIALLKIIKTLDKNDNQRHAINQLAEETFDILKKQMLNRSREDSEYLWEESENTMGIVVLLADAGLIEPALDAAGLVCWEYEKGCAYLAIASEMIQQKDKRYESLLTKALGSVSSKYYDDLYARTEINVRVSRIMTELRHHGAEKQLIKSLRILSDSVYSFEYSESLDEFLSELKEHFIVQLQRKAGAIL